jgi:hypothetical protein
MFITQHDVKYYKSYTSVLLDNQREANRRPSLTFCTQFPFLNYYLSYNFSEQTILSLSVYHSFVSDFVHFPLCLTFTVNITNESKKFF